MRGSGDEPQVVRWDRDRVQCCAEHMLEKPYTVGDCLCWVLGAIKGRVDVWL